MLKPAAKINFLMVRDIFIKTCEDGIDDLISIPDTAEIYEQFQYADGSFEYIIVDDYNSENISQMMKYSNDYDVISYNNTYVMIIVNAIDIAGCDIKKEQFKFPTAYVRFYKENPHIWELAKGRFGVDLSGMDEYTDEQLEFLKDNVTFDIAFMKIRKSSDVHFLVDKVHIKTKSGSPKFAIEYKKIGFCSAFDTQYDLTGVSNKADTVYSEFCTKEEYDDALCRVLTVLGVKKFEV